VEDLKKKKAEDEVKSHAQKLKEQIQDKYAPKPIAEAK